MKEIKKVNSGWKKVLVRIVQKTGILPVFVIMICIFAIINPNFRNPLNIVNILQQNVIMGIISCGMTFMIITGGFDLSVGSVAALAALFGAYGFLNNFVLGILCGLAAGALIGSINGLLISRIKINPFVTTLGTMVIARGLVLIIAGGYPVYGFPRSYNVIGMGKIGFMPIATLIWAIIVVISHFVLNRTLFGQYMYAVGGNEKAASLSGIKTNNIKFKVFFLGSILASLAGIILLLRTMSATAYMGTSYELKAIAACVVGGCSLDGGKGSIFGTVVGVLLMGAIANALHVFGVSPYWEDAITGIIIIGAVSMQKLTEKMKQ